jgi:hypothetical protein
VLSKQKQLESLDMGDSEQNLFDADRDNENSEN